MERMMLKIPPGDPGKHIRQNSRNAAIPIKGIAAFFHSTRFYVFLYLLSKFDGIFVFVQRKVWSCKRLSALRCFFAEKVPITNGLTALTLCFVYEVFHPS